MILLEMVFLPKLKIHRVTAKTNKQNKTSASWIHGTPTGICCMELPKCQMRFHNASPRIICDSDWNRTSILQYAILVLVRTSVRHFRLSDVSWSTHRFHTRTCPFSFHFPSGHRSDENIHSISLQLILCILQTWKPCALGHFRRKRWRCVRPDQPTWVYPVNLFTEQKPNQTKTQCYLSEFSEQDHPQWSSGKGPSNCTLKYGRCRQQTLHERGHEDCCPGTSRASLPLSHKYGISWHLTQYANPCQHSFARTVQKS